MKTQLIDSIILFLVTMVIYTITLCPSVYVGDSGELTSAALTLGIAHPPGYPIYVILGKCFSLLIPGGPSALELNLFSALLGALSSIMLYHVMRIIGTGRIVSISTALMLAFLNPFWSQAVVARVYTLNAFLILSAIYFLLRYCTTRDFKNMYYYFLFLGFGLANHPVTIITLPAALLFVICVKNDQKFHPLSWLKFFLSTLPGASLYLFLPLRSMTNPAINWGNPGKGKRLMDFIMRTEYWDRKYVHNIQDAIEVVWFYMGLVPRELMYAGLFFLCLGAYMLYRKQKLIGLLFLCVCFFNILFMIMHASRSDIFYWPRYIIPAFISIIAVTGIGMNTVMLYFKRIRWLPLICLILPTTQCVFNYHLNDRSHNTLAEDINIHILEQLPPDAALMAQGDNVLFPITYFHHVLDMRPDVKLFEVGMNQLSAFEFDPRKNPTFFTHYNDLGVPELNLIPDGLVYQVVTSDMTPPPIHSAQELLDTFSLKTLQQDKPVYLDYLSRCMLGDYYFMIAANVHRKSFKDALPLYRKAGEIAYNNDVVHYNLGLVYGREHRYYDAMQEFKTVLEIDRKNIKAPQYINQFAALANQQASAKNVSTDPFDQLFVRAERQFKQGQLDAAHKSLLESLKLRPNSVSALNNLATLYIFQGNYKDALSIYQQVSSIEPNNVVAQKNYAWLTGIDQKIQSITQTISDSSDDSERAAIIQKLSDEAQSSINSGNPHEALFFLHTALTYDTNNTDLHNSLAQLYISIGMPFQAKPHLQKMLELDPDNDTLKMKLNSFPGTLNR